VLPRLFSALVAAFLMVGSLPAGVFAATPTADPVTATTAEDTAVTITLTATDSDGADLVSFQAAAGPSHGTLDAVSAPTCPPETPGTCSAEVQYHPAHDYSGGDSFTYTAIGADGPSAPAMVSITITPVNDPPVCSSASGPAMEDATLGPVSITCIDVDTPAGDLIYSKVTDPSHGTLTLGPGASFTYEPDPDFNLLMLPAPGGDPFTFKASDGSADSNTATWTVLVEPVDDVPTFTPGIDPVTVAEDSGAHSSPWATAIDPGPNESYQTVDFLVTSTNHALFSSLPAIAADGTLTFTPAANFNGTSTVTVRAHDNGGAETPGAVDTSGPVTFAINVSAVNDAPAPVPTSASMAWGIPSLITLSASDIEGDATTAFNLATQPTHGDVAIQGPITCDSGHPNACTAAAIYTPDAGYTGSDGFTFTATDGTDVSMPAAVSITVGANAAPVCGNTNTTVAEDGSQNGTLACTDAENETLTYARAGASGHGTANVSTNGAWTYSPNGDYHGSDSFTFTATDANGVSNTATMSITVTSVNDAPVCANTSPTAAAEDTPQGGTLVCPDVDTAAGSLTYSKVAGPSHGALTVNANGSWSYTPADNYFGSDSFTFKANDSQADSNTATVNLTITSVNDAPVCTPVTTSTAEDTATGGTVSCTDVEGDPLTYSLSAAAGHGVAAVGPGTAWTYSPAADYYGSDAFTFRANDGQASSSPADVTLTVTPVNDKPVCTGAALATDKNAVVKGSVSCTDIDGGPLTLRLGTLPLKGAVDPFNTSTGAFTYTPAFDVTGSDSFTVIARDGAADSDPATVTIDIANNAPTCTGATPPAANEDTGQAGTLACADPDSDALTYTVDALPAHGILVLDAGTGAWTYTPAQDWSGLDSFTAHASDGVATSNTATVSLEVTAVNDPPVADARSISVEEDSALDTIHVTGSDVEGSSLTYSVLTQPAHGTLAGSAPDLTYTPTPNYNGPDAFTFKANDGLADSQAATVSITVNDLNDKPDAKNDASGAAGFPYVAATTTTTLNVLANDIAGPKIGATLSEPNDTISITSVSAPALGSVSIAPGGTALVYDPRGCATGTDVFTYTVTDGQGLPDTATVVVTVARPGAGGLGNAPITDTPSVGLRSGATIGSTVPVRISWCGVTKSGARLKGYRVGQSSNAGSSWPIIVTSATTGTAVNRSIGTSATYAWRVRMTDNANRIGLFRTSGTTKAAILQEANASIVYAGSWGTKALSKASGGRVRFSSSPSASATITVTNTRQFGIVAPKGRGYGSVKVWVDGVYAGAFSEKASTASYRKVLFVRSLNPGTPHTITLRPASGTRVYLDAIVTLQ
jgi:large repetitive protein